MHTRRRGHPGTVRAALRPGGGRHPLGPSRWNWQTQAGLPAATEVLQQRAIRTDAELASTNVPASMRLAPPYFRFYPVWSRWYDSHAAPWYGG